MSLLQQTKLPPMKRVLTSCAVELLIGVALAVLVHPVLGIVVAVVLIGGELLLRRKVKANIKHRENVERERAARAARR